VSLGLSGVVLAVPDGGGGDDGDFVVVVGVGGVGAGAGDESESDEGEDGGEEGDVTATSWILMNRP
jgi:hypothetical protein